MAESMVGADSSLSECQEPLRKKGGTSTCGRSSSEIAILNPCVGNVRIVTYTL
jgi:hypothetical protein